MAIPKRLERQNGRYALVDGIPFHLPVNSESTPALMAAFPVNFERAAALMPGNEVHPFRWGRKALLVVTVVDYRITDIGRYIEYSIAIACTHGEKPAPRVLPMLFRNHYGTGQFVVDLPVSTEISVKGGKGIWGMPKHQANLDFVVGPSTVSSQYDLDGRMVMRIDVARPKRTPWPVRLGAVNYCQFRGMLMKSYIYFRGRAGVSLFRPTSARIVLGDHPRAAALKALDIEPPIFSGFFPSTAGILDDHFECWFLSYDRPPAAPPEGLETTVDLGLGQEWLAPPRRGEPERDGQTAALGAAS